MQNRSQLDSSLNVKKAVALREKTKTPLIMLNPGYVSNWKSIM